MIIVGLALLLIGWLLGISLLLTIGLIVLVVGLIVLALGHFHGPVGGRRYWW